MVLFTARNSISDNITHERILKQHNTQYSGQMGKKNQNEVMVEICSKSLVGAIGKVLHVKFS